MHGGGGDGGREEREWVGVVSRSGEIRAVRRRGEAGGGAEKLRL